MVCSRWTRAYYCHINISLKIRETKLNIDKKLPCYECLCLAACRGRTLGQLMVCKPAYNYIHYIDKPECERSGYPYVGKRYDSFFKYLRLYDNIKKRYDIQ